MLKTIFPQQPPRSPLPRFILDSIKESGGGYVSAKQYTKLSQQFEEHWTTFTRIELIGEVLALARVLLERHPLRAMDAIHLASAMSLQKGIQEPLQFAAADNRLLEAALAEHLSPLEIEAIKVKK